MNRPNPVICFDDEYGVEYENLILKMIPGYGHMFLLLTYCSESYLKDHSSLLTV